MRELIWLIPLIPLLSSVTLMLAGSRLPRLLIGITGVGSVGLAALLTLATGLDFLANPEIFQLTLWTWIQVGSFAPGVAFYFDGLTLVMMSVITGVGFLIHLFSTEFMEQDESYARYFAYLNMFVAAMLVLVMADNLLLLYLGWEGVGVCSYLLVGFWYQNSANGQAARKAFIVTRIGDTAMALGLFLLFTELGTLDIQAMVGIANETWQVGDNIPLIACLLLLAGAVGKSAQLPLHTWLPDAMAGPTPVSALIHAATMVTAGVYLIARTHGLFLLAPEAMMAVAVIGIATTLMAAFTALMQSDIKRILAYSTISQIGYMFLALGVGAWTAGIFHLMTHAFFKALLFLGSGAIIHCLHHEHNIFKMGGLRTRMPVTFWSFMIGSAALAALPMTSGFFSKDQILLQAYQMPGMGPWLWLAGLLGALLTAIYSFRLVFVVFFGGAKTEPDKDTGWRMALPLTVLCGLSLIGGYFIIPVQDVFPVGSGDHPAHWVEYVSISVPLFGVLLAYLIFHTGQLRVDSLVNSRIGKTLGQFWLSGWGIDWLYDRLFVRPYYALSGMLKSEPVDAIYGLIVAINQTFNHWLSVTQTGRMRWYIVSMVFGLVVLLTLALQISPEVL
ncbi:NADH-quinone oxidoreductase subunit L [Porticoccaceae bacterium]|nr:NADH-quinone oxidoreductase subunit L [Porticoccaceae bacterium]MDB4262578.1 NADH-quinone oxidoreductase subunit L [Porticoccaceae bacterium]MDB4308778.1 NADH-quinone oxidoreductase subunit L [Porticoccaceae bacterium]MDB9953619.1 NADH-quinone oxidoreductase subunit L [Porticoccaceae bacterium]MDB9999969.1 NADH-quinone oxidoreductase subunit L [Porticoccaceae bacterium]